MSSYERHNTRFESPRETGARGAAGGGAMANRGHWVSDNRREEFPAKRRRY